MFKTYFLLTLICVSNVKSWDIAITAENLLEFHTNGTKIDVKDVRLTDLTALAYDAVHNILLFVDSRSDNASIFSYSLARNYIQPLVRRKVSDNIQGLAFDPLSGLLFWTDSTDRSIMSTSLFLNSTKNSGYGNLLLKTDEEIPRAIAVDSCRGYIYWTNTYLQNSTIERMRFDGTERKVIVHEDLFMPTSIAIDQREQTIYWSDDRLGIDYSIESIDFDGNNKKTIYKGQNHMPNSLTVSKDFIYWTDWGFKTVWKYPKHANSWKEPKEVTKYNNIKPFGIVANYNIEDQIHGIPECKDLERLSRNGSATSDIFQEVTGNEGLFCLHGHKVEDKLVCECIPGYRGERCEISVCENYCLNGDCSVTPEGKPTCKCRVGYKGLRCEVDLCMDYYCLNNGICRFNESSNATMCICTSDYDGSRCETLKSPVLITSSSDACNCSSSPNNMINSDTVDNSGGVIVDTDNWDPLRDPLIMVLATMTGTLSVVCAVLVFKIMQLKKRPRIKKRIIVNKNVTPLTARPDQCEITIENCCNMNICETPCFEPRTIRPNLCDAKPGKEEKKNLIANMEHQDDLY